MCSTCSSISSLWWAAASRAWAFIFSICSCCYRKNKLCLVITKDKHNNRRIRKKLQSNQRSTSPQQQVTVLTIDDPLKTQRWTGKYNIHTIHYTLHITHTIHYTHIHGSAKNKDSELSFAHRALWPQSFGKCESEEKMLVKELLHIHILYTNRLQQTGNNMHKQNTDQGSRGHEKECLLIESQAHTLY